VSWSRRGKPGAFADPAIRRFHRSLIATGLPRGEVDLLRIAAGGADVGFLYNFRWQGRVHAYQSGFYYPDNPQQKPGLTCHALAIEAYRAEGMRCYDFLAGDDRYKTSLAPDLVRLHWLELAHPGSLRGLALRGAALRESWRNRPAQQVAAEADGNAGAVADEFGGGAVVADGVGVDHHAG
jgi:CelD/BcsL family acetyltransferase involved in cellulose biosynthesis